MLKLDKRQVEEVWRLVNDLAIWCQIHGKAVAIGDGNKQTMATGVILETRQKLCDMGIKPPE